MLTLSGLDEVKSYVGKELGVSDWHLVTQETINQFAAVTGDDQWIHVDVERAKDTPFGGTIAHGYLTLSMAAWIMGELVHVSARKMGVNSGLDRVRFPAPLPVGAQWRGGGEIVDVTDVPGG